VASSGLFLERRIDKKKKNYHHRFELGERIRVTRGVLMLLRPVSWGFFFFTNFPAGKQKYYKAATTTEQFPKFTYSDTHTHTLWVNIYI
jgi:hypothetical protein